MKVNIAYCQTALWTALLLMVVWGCAGKPFDPPTPGEIPKGPGVFTKGEDGAVLFDSKRKQKKPSADQTPKAAPADTGKPVNASDYEEFEAYQQWLEWKKSAGNDSDYEAFKQWQEWRQYQQWKKSK